MNVFPCGVAVAVMQCSAGLSDTAVGGRPGPGMQGSWGQLPALITLCTPFPLTVNALTR